MSILLIWLSGLVFGLLHSLTASNRCKRFFYLAGMLPHHYRLAYSVLGVLTTILWLWFVYQLPDAQLYQTSGFVWWFLFALQAIGVGIALAAFIPINGAIFLGFQKAGRYQDPFIVSGVYRYIRHPMYSGVMLILLAMPEQTINGFNLALLVCVYFIMGSKFEEKRMLVEHPSYAKYQDEVPAFIPNKMR
ncbi:MAG: NnrU family protein [Ghiorsea sp.]